MVSLLKMTTLIALIFHPPSFDVVYVFFIPQEFSVSVFFFTFLF